MAKYRTRNTEARIARLRADGRGQGTGADYVPWLKIHDFSSLGRVHRRMSAKSGREVHLMSDGEDDVFLQLDTSPIVTDIREQFPLDRAATILIAEELGFRHPAANGVDVVMTSDFLVVWTGGASTAIAVKTPEDLRKRRTREKLEIERAFWSDKHVRWFLNVVDKPDRALRLNHQEIAEWRAVDDLREGPVEWELRASLMLVALLHAFDGRLIDVCVKAEREHAWEPGVGISACKRLMALGRVRHVGGGRFDPMKSVRQLEISAEVSA